MKDYLQTVTGPVAREDMGLTLPHEHLFNDLSSVVDAPCYPFSQRLVDKKVTAEIQWALKHDPYCCADNMDRKPIEDVIFEINNFICKRKLTAVCSHQTRIGNLDAHLI